MSIRSDLETTVVNGITRVATSSMIIIIIIMMMIIIGATGYKREVVHGHKWGAW